MDELKEIKSHLKVEVGNGKKTIRWVDEVITDMWTDTEILRDMNRIHRINKKYKIYWIAGLILSIYGGSSLVSIITGFIKAITN